VSRLDKAVASVDGKGFEMTPLSRQPALAAAASVPTDSLWVKDETGNVGGSHKARHLFGVLLHLAVENENEGELAIASCGNAALAAAVIARAAERSLRVFVPTWADPAVIAQLESLGATIEISERRQGEIGDPTVLRLLEAVRRGAVPFSVQGPITPTAVDGGRTIGWELAEQLSVNRISGRVALLVQVGGGALATATWQGLNDGIDQQWLDVEPVLHTVQTEAAAPLNRAWRSLVAGIETDLSLDHDDVVDLALRGAREDPEHFMWAWEEVGTTAASGIVDDVTYDWLPIMEAMLRSSGRAEVVNEKMILRANQLARAHTGIDVSHTGSAGLAGLLDPTMIESLYRGQHLVVLFTGVEHET
jgi:threonine synthase